MNQKKSNNQNFSDSLNYTTNAIESLLKAEPFLKIYPHSIDPYRNILALLNKSVKFILPNKGFLLDDSLSIDNIKQEWIDLTILPFPIITFEIPFITDENDVLEDHEIKSSKRIMLCWDINSDDETIQKINNDFASNSPIHQKKLKECQALEGFAYISIAYIDHLDVWNFNPMSLFFSYNLQLNEKENGKSLEAIPLNIFPDYADDVAKKYFNGSVDILAQVTTTDNQAELIATIQACCTLNCSNVQTQDLVPPAKLNSKRVKKGKPPFFTYKVLEVSNPKGGSSISLSDTESSRKRTHFRRGHLRRYKTGKVSWVQASIVNPNNKSNIGIVTKDYKVVSPKI